MVRSPTGKIVFLTTAAMIAFAANSILCRLALKHGDIDPGNFTVLRLASGAVVLWLLAWFRQRSMAIGGHWYSALALFAYAAGFSFAYVSLPTATGALLLFGAVQLTMVGFGLWRGERLHGWQLPGFLLACGGLVGLLLPGLSAPPLHGAMLMLGAGIAWGVYSLLGKGTGDPMRITAGNFMRTLPLVIVLISWSWLHRDTPTTSAGVAYALVSGAVTSGIGYALWYAVLPALRATTAATVQLSVPVLAALGGIVFLAEPITARLLAASAAVLGGIALMVVRRR